MSIYYFALGLLNQKSMSGYDIKRLINSLGWLMNGPSFGNIYSTLHGLLEDGLVTVDVIPNQNKPPRKVYSITEAGRVVLGKWEKQAVGAQVSLKTFVMRLIVAGSFTRESLISQLQQRYEQVASYHTALEESRETIAEEIDPQRLVRDYALALAVTELAWLDSTLNRLSQQPLPLEVGQGS